MLDLDSFKGFNDTCGHPAGDALLAAIAQAMAVGDPRRRPLYRYGGDEFAAILPGADRMEAHEVAERIRAAVAEATLEASGPHVTISAGVACYPDDGRTKDALVSAADQALYLAKTAARVTRRRPAWDDPYLRALDETTLALLDRRDSAILLETILTRPRPPRDAARLHLPRRARRARPRRPPRRPASSPSSSAISLDRQGRRRPGLRDRRAVRRRRLRRLRAARARSVPTGIFGAVVGVPLTCGDEVVGVIGLASGTSERPFGPREIDALTRFAQLASIALDNARLVDDAQRGALYDPMTGLPNRELLTDRIAHALASASPDEADPIAVILLDLDRFKVINESLGHASATACCWRSASGSPPASARATRSRGSAATSSGSSSTTSADVDDARRIADRLVQELRAPFSLDGRDWFISASLGIAIGRPGPRHAGRPAPRGRDRARPREGRSGRSATPCSSRR